MMGSQLLSPTVFAGTAGLVWALLGGCDSRPEEPVLAEVNGEPITVSEFREFDEHIPDGMKEGETPREANRQVLKSLIDKRLLLLEAAATGIEQDTRFETQLAQYESTRLRKLYYDREVVRKIDITAEEIERHYRESGRDRALRLGGIMVNNLQEARDLIARLERGADFFELARERSVHERTAQRGGDIGYFQTRDQMSPNAVGHVIHLEMGQLSEPVREVYAEGEAFVIYKVLDEIPAPLSASEKIIIEKLTLQKRDERARVLQDSLLAAYAPQVRGESVSLLVERAQAPGKIQLSPAEAGQVVCSYRDGELTLAEFLEAAERITGRRPQAADSAQVVDLLQDRILRDLISVAEIEAAGLRRDANFQQQLALEREELLLSALRRREVDEYVDATEEEARDYYDENPEKFTAPETAVIAEIVVASDTLAQRLRQELLAGADAEELAVSHTLREGAGHHRGKLNVSLFTQSLFPDIYQEVQDLEVGDVGGPLKVEEGYSVFKILERGREKAPYNDESQRRARAYVLIDKSKNSYVNFVRDLRGKYPVEVFAENLHQIED